jgi:hypothetical protein
VADALGSPSVVDRTMPAGPGPLADGYHVDRHLRALTPSLVLGADTGGTLWAMLEARAQGSGYHDTRFVIVAAPDGPSAPQAPAPAAASYEAALTGAVERRGLELVDHVIAAEPARRRWQARGVQPDGRWLAEVDVPASLGAPSVTASEPGAGGAGRATPAPAADQDRPLVSVVLTPYERPSMARRAIDSLLAQTWERLEIVVVDDGSTSSEAASFLAELERRTFDRPLTVVRKPNGGLGSARNLGVCTATADYVAFLDDDDEAEPTYIERMMGALSHTGAAAAVVGFKVFPDASSGALEGRREQLHWLYFSAAPHLAVLDNCIGGAAALMRKKDLLAVGGYHTHRRLAYEDWQVLVKLALDGRGVVSVPECLLRYRVAAGSMLRTYSATGSHELVLEPFVASLPPALAEWPRLLYGLHNGQRAAAEAATALQADHDELVAELESARRELAELRLEADHRQAMLRSPTWRVGQLVVAPLSRLRSLWRRRPVR